MTYIEFFDHNEIENLCTCLTHRPDRMILVGAQVKKLEAYKMRYTEFLQSRGCHTEVLCRGINRNNLWAIVEQLSQMVETYEDCVFDLTGGEDLYLVAVGIVWERYRDAGKNLQMHRFNIKTGAIVDCDRDGVTVAEGTFPRLTVEENVRIYGGDVVYSDRRENGTYRWDLNPDFCKDVETMWDICRQRPVEWNVRTTVLSIAEACRFQNDDPLVTEAYVCEVAARHGRGSDGRTLWSYDFFNRLRSSGLIREFYVDDDKVRVVYKNEQVKRCLTKAGMALEMKIFLLAHRAVDAKGERIYNDVANGVCIDWDGRIHEGWDAPDTQNEIDVMMMRDAVPVFVSCKNGAVTMEELYKLNTVAEQFGGKYAKKVLIITDFKGGESSELQFRKRADDMGIRIVSDIMDTSDEELTRQIASFWCND